MFKKSLCLIGMLSFGAAMITAQNTTQVNSVLSESLFSELKKKGVISRTFNNQENVQLTLTPATPLAGQAVTQWKKDNTENPVFVVENLYMLKKATLAANRSAPGKADTSLAVVSRVIRSISKMQGMQYYSNSDKKWETLYHQSYLIDSVKAKNRIADKTSGSADGLTLYCLQEDNSFGTCIYRLNYSESPQEVSVCFTNEEPLKYGPIKAVKPHNLKINLVVIDNGDYYLVYMLVQAKYMSFPFLEGRLNRSFNARIDAIYKWFTFQF
jgi:hypothetical protein